MLDFISRFIINSLYTCEMIKLCILMVFIYFVNAGAILNNIPITFMMGGPTTYIPDTGGAVQNGYLLTLGYQGSSWLGVQFVSSTLKSDFLVLKISDFYTNNGALFNGHLVSYVDYFSTQGLNSDTITTYDISSYTYSSTKSYNLQITRYLGSNNGEDWDGNANKYSVQKICFYTSGLSFDPNTYNQFSSACYNYEINNLVSTFVGPYLKSFNFNGYSTSIYGYIDGPLLVNNLYFYQQTPLLSYVQVPAIAIQIGTTDGNKGQDYYAFSPIASENGDYYGSSISQKYLDNTANGFQNPALTLLNWNADPANQISGLSITSLRISFSRQVYTFDAYDKSMQSTFLFCMYMYSSGSINSALSDKSCEIVELSPSYVSAAYTSFEKKVELLILVCSVVILSIFI